MMVVLYSIFSVQKSTCFIVSAVSCRPPSVDPGLDPHAVIIERRRRPGFIVASKRGYAQWVALFTALILPNSRHDRLANGAYQFVIEVASTTRASCRANLGSRLCPNSRRHDHGGSPPAVIPWIKTHGDPSPS
jgi:hypothetical protein